MTAEQIVRALAAADPTVSSGEWDWCGTCDSRWPIEADDHDPACPWRMAVEWVAEQDQTIEERKT